MKQPKKPTRNQKELMFKRGLVSSKDKCDWMIVSENKEELEIINKMTGECRTIEK